MTLENYIKERDQNFKSQGDQANQRIASTNSRLERLDLDIKKIQGELGTLRVGIVTGQLPGSDPEQEGSIAQTINNIISRLEEVESSQGDIKSAIEDASKTTKGKNRNKKRKKIKKVGDLKKAFQGKRFKHVAEDAGPILKAEKNAKLKREILFIYAESLYKLGKLRDAALKFNEFLEKKPTDNAARAKLRMGDCFRHLGDPKTATLYYEQLISEHPKETDADIAKDRLAKMKR